MGGRMKKISYSLILVVILSSFVYAEPNAATRYLIKTSASLLDFAIYKLEERLNKLSISDVKEYEYKHKEKILNSIKLEAEVSYDYGNNKIIVFSRPEDMQFIASGLNESKSICQKIHQRINEKIQMGLMFDSIFSHEGYKDKDQPDNLDDEVLKLIQFESKIKFREKDDDLKDAAPVLKCKAPIMSQEIFYSEQKGKWIPPKK